MNPFHLGISSGVNLSASVSIFSK